MMRVFALVVMLLTGAVMAGCGSDSAAEVPIRGTLSYDSSVALPANASARVSLVERAKDNTDKRIVAERSLHDLGQPPIEFELDISQHLLNPDGRYGMRAVILDSRGNNLWHTRTAVPIEPQNRHDTVSLDLESTDRSTAKGRQTPNSAQQVNDNAMTREIRK